jgi:valyl-tRNA synthetase
MEIMRRFTNASSFEFTEQNTFKDRTPVSYVSFGGKLFMPTENLIDVEAEKARLKKELEKIEAEISKVEAKLSNPNFAQKVPATVLEEHKQRLIEWQNKLSHAKAALDALQN